MEAVSPLYSKHQFRWNIIANFLDLTNLNVKVICILWWCQMVKILSSDIRKPTFRHVRKPAFGHMQPAKIQINLHIDSAWIECSSASFWLTKVQSFFMMTVNTLIRLLGCAGLFESLLDPHVRRYIFSHCFSLNPSPAEPGYALPLQTV